jgi:hypothetical protein
MGESAAKLAIDLTTLSSLSHTRLKEQWAETFGTAPPKGLSRRLLICALAYEAQAKDLGRLKALTRKQLVEIATSNAPGPAAEAPPLTTGTRLMREWRGTVHVVDMTEDGLVWNGRIYPSLSAIARTITGTRWSGQRFFGLRKRSDAASISKVAQSTSLGQDSPQAYAPGKMEYAAKSDPLSQVTLEPLS